MKVLSDDLREQRVNALIECSCDRIVTSVDELFESWNLSFKWASRPVLRLRNHGAFVSRNILGMDYRIGLNVV
ncbi:MAG: hypothetical protein ABSG91_02720 [Syntrophobacteraceae bacterium]|jgi:hypothetical protein